MEDLVLFCVVMVAAVYVLSALVAGTMVLWQGARELIRRAIRRLDRYEDYDG